MKKKGRVPTVVSNLMEGGMEHLSITSVDITRYEVSRGSLK